MTVSIPQVSIVQVQAEHHESGFGIGVPNPRLSWRFDVTTAKNWVQTGYEIEIVRNGKTETYTGSTSQSTLVPWPSSPLASRERAEVRVRALGAAGATEWTSLSIEVALLDRAEWKGSLISADASIQPIDKPKTPFRLSRKFDLDTLPSRARIYATAHGIYTLELNGRAVGDQVLMPGWQSYKARLAYQVFDITSLLRQGENEIVAYVGEGWFATRLWPRNVRRNNFGSRLGLLAQLEVDGSPLVVTDDSWAWSTGPVLGSEIYNGETFDSRIPASVAEAETQAAQVIDGPTAELFAPDAPPVRRILEVRPKELITTLSGKKIIDFGQNVVGWLRVESELKGASGNEVAIRFAEVLEHGELGVRPLRTAEATDRVILGGKVKGWEPRFTFHGFRYAEVSGLGSFTLADFTAIVVSSDMRRTGTFDSSHSAINRLHENVVWGMRGNFVSVPTDCPQRDERMGWTGDIQVFAPTASFLFDTYSFLSGWLRDVEAEQRSLDGVVPVVIPWVPLASMEDGAKPAPHAVWGDVAAITPDDLYTAFGDTDVLAKQFDSMCAWLDKGIPRGTDYLWDANTPQFADWLDPKAPPQYPAHGMTDTHLVANAYLVYTTGLVAKIAQRIGRDADAKRYSAEFEDLKRKFQHEYISPSGRMTSDTQAAIALALHFDLFPTPEQRAHAVSRLEYLIRWDHFKISTGFAGTPIILNTLANNGLLHLAYRMLQERDNPSWLYSVLMGATTIWERWDSMLPDGTINPGQMTSFNHYALGSVATFLHRVVGGLSPLEPGWKKALVAPRPGGTVTSAVVSYDSVYGPYSCKWVIENGRLKVDVGVPPNASAKVVLGEGEGQLVQEVGSGEYSFEVEWKGDPRWPPKPQPGPQSTKMPCEFVP